MPRLPRIEFEGAVYHVMARGNHRGKTVFHDEDCRSFIKTFEEAIEKTKVIINYLAPYLSLTPYLSGRNCSESLEPM